MHTRFYKEPKMGGQQPDEWLAVVRVNPYDTGETRFRTEKYYVRLKYSFIGLGAVREMKRVIAEVSCIKTSYCDWFLDLCGVLVSST